jgi:signal transduction histidine kinase
MITNAIFAVVLVGNIVISALLIYSYHMRYSRLKSDNLRLAEELSDIKDTITEQVKERTKKLEGIRDSITGYAVQRFEVAQELEKSNRELLEQKDLSAKQTEKLRQAYEEIKNLEGFRKQMIRTLVHDLKNPLNIILNLTDTDQIPAKPGNLIRQISFEMLDLIINLLEVQKLEEMEIKPQLENIDFSKIVQINIQKIHSLLSMSELEFKSTIPDSCWILADRQMLNRIISNLLSNSVKYTRAGGLIEITASEKETEWLIEITDNGEGIAEKDMESLFEMFGQGSKKSVSYNSSTGIGLAYCRLAVNAMGGNIGIRSQEEEGTTVWFTCNKGIASSDPLSESVKPSVDIGIPDFDFTVSDKEILMKIIPDLQCCDIFEITKIISLLGNPSLNSNYRLIRWKKSVEETLYSANLKRFRDLIQVN